MESTADVANREEGQNGPVSIHSKFRATLLFPRCFDTQQFCVFCLGGHNCKDDCDEHPFVRARPRCVEESARCSTRCVFAGPPPRTAVTRAREASCGARPAVVCPHRSAGYGTVPRRYTVL